MKFFLTKFQKKRKKNLIFLKRKSTLEPLFFRSYCPKFFFLISKIINLPHLDPHFPLNLPFTFEGVPLHFCKCKVILLSRNSVLKFCFACRMSQNDSF